VHAAHTPLARVTENIVVLLITVQPRVILT
jgi:hypothetical protein